VTVRPLLSRYPVAPWAELGVGDTRVPSGQARWDVARWDTPDASWAGTEPTWLDVSCESIVASSDAGRVRTTERFAPGTADVTLRNVSGWADMSGRPVPPAALPLRPGRQFRYGVDTPTGRHLLYRGYIDEAIPLYQPRGGDVVTANMVDALGEVGRIRLAAADPPVGGGETVTARIHRILDAAQWPATYRDVDASAVTLLATGLGAGCADLLSIAADSAGGAVFGDLAGRLAFRPIDWQTYMPDDPPAATIGNVDPADVCPQAWEMSFRRRDVAAVSTMHRVDGTGVTAVGDYDTLVTIGPEPFERSDLETEHDAHLTRMAHRVLVTRGIAAMPRVEAVTLDAANDPGDGSTVELMATARPETPTRLRCRLVESGRLVFDRQMFVTGAAHTITEHGRWACRLTLDVADPFAAAGGRWDRAGWDRTLWADAATLTGVH
jgi:hypothetical protein